MISQSHISFLDLLLFKEVKISCLVRLQYTILPLRDNSIGTCISLSSYSTILITIKRLLSLIEKVHQETSPALSSFQRPEINSGDATGSGLRLIKAWVKNDFRLQCPPARFAEFAWTARVTIVTWNQDRVVRERHPPF